MHLAFYFKIFTGEVLVRNDYLMVVIGIAICYFVASINTWARGAELFLQHRHPCHLPGAAGIPRGRFRACLMLTITVIVLFALATYYLLRKDTAEFFRSVNADKTQDSE